MKDILKGKKIPYIRLLLSTILLWLVWQETGFVTTLVIGLLMLNTEITKYFLNELLERTVKQAENTNRLAKLLLKSS